MEAAAQLKPVEGRETGPQIAELTPGMAFSGSYACVRKDRQLARNGSAYLSLELRDRSGSIPARIFAHESAGGSMLVGRAATSFIRSRSFPSSIVSSVICPMPL